MATCPKCFQDSDGAHCPSCRAAMEAHAVSRDDLAKTVVSAPAFVEADQPAVNRAPPPDDTLPRPMPAAVTDSGNIKLASPASLPPGAPLGDTRPDPSPAVRFGQPADKPADRPAPSPAEAPPVASDLPPTVLAPVDSAAHQEIPPTVHGSVPEAPEAPAAPEVPPTVTADVAEVHPTAPTAPGPLPVPAVPGPGVDTSASTLPTGATLNIREPGRGLMRLLMALGGLALIGLFLAPWDGERFFWQQRITGLGFAFRLFLAAGGVVFLAGALIPIPYGLRALVACLVGLTPVALAKVMELQASSLGPEQLL